MKIIKNLDQTRLEVVLDGRLDTSTAPEVEADLMASLDGVEELVIDLEKMPYVSSAGLRVFLKLQKKMNTQGSMKLIHADKDILEIFEITGFAEIMNIE